MKPRLRSTFAFREGAAQSAAAEPRPEEESRPPSRQRSTGNWKPDPPNLKDKLKKRKPRGKSCSANAAILASRAPCPPFQSLQGSQPERFWEAGKFRALRAGTPPGHSHRIDAPAGATLHSGGERRFTWCSSSWAGTPRKLWNSLTRKPCRRLCGRRPSSPSRPIEFLAKKAGRFLARPYQQ